MVFSGVASSDKSRGVPIVKKVVLVFVGLPVLAALAGLVLAPTVLHPIHRSLTKSQIQEADRAFARVGAAREYISVRADDGVILRGWKVRAAHPNGDWVLLMHGRSHNRAAMLPHAEFLLQAGYGVVMMDARRHGESGGAMSTYGAIERYDAKPIVDALEATEKVNHVFALGESMGAAVALQSAAVEPRITAVVAEGAFRNLREVTFDYAGLQESAFLGKTVFRPAALVSDYFAEREGGFRFAEVSPEDAVKARRFRLLLICGLSDRKIPCRHSEAIYGAAIGAKELWRVPGAGHEKALATEPEEFPWRVLTFFDEAGRDRSYSPPEK
jgi:hypothetical protein